MTTQAGQELGARSGLKAIYPDLKGRTVLVSGGATGIGRALVEAFARQGARTAFVDLADAPGQALQRQLQAEGHEVQFKLCDITDVQAYQQVIQQVAEQYGPITVLANNAANDVRHSLDSLGLEQFDALVSVNLKHAMFAAQAVAPMMRKAGGGSIINFGSVGWMMATAGYPVYAASKAAVHGMTRGLARELGGDRIRVNTLVPGWVMTEKQLQLWVDESAKELIKRSQCMAGSVVSEDIADMALFLASDAASMCSAQNFIVDGGWV
ncbi:SDR family NAD(P)-dependent oxidoreductase [Marinobacterium sedimentorum]|uniref:SDR family NAD(P)-dependent oxidoreductase n=1 Tax=Marinobacterium sedimentorum TaxID=2927804 RepID=UPI0020C6F6C0|nr:SDR family oxidoreductase [Marinobacterium sedimentorum]MCP8687321.1 SDR family oxidoreductase [Marinobacterium sedimentorum]